MKTKKVKQTKLDKITKTDGEYITPPSEPPKARNMDEIFGVKKVRYAQSDVDDYRTWLEAQNMVELQDHAIELGQFANGERNRLINRLLNEFNVYQSLASKVDRSYQQPRHAQTISPEVAKILSTGK